jgi:hypothetical protein
MVYEYKAMLSGSAVSTAMHLHRLRIRDGLKIWKVAVNILNKKSRTADSGWSSGLGLGREHPPPPHHKKAVLYKTIHTASELDGFSDKTEAPENGYEIWNVEY